MNLLNLQVKIRKINIKSNKNSSIAFSLRLGRLLSQMSTPLVKQPNQVMDINIDLSIGCQDNIVNENSRACLVIYEMGSSQQRDIIGMVFILLKNTQEENQRYRIQQCADPQAFIQLSFSISNIQVKQKQNQSVASKSSLAQIKQLHRVLSRGHKRSESDHSLQQKQIKKFRLSPEDKDFPSKNSRNSNRVSQVKSQDGTPFDNQQNQAQYESQLKKTQMQLTRQRQKNCLLTNLLVIQQTKNDESQKLLLSIINAFRNRPHSSKKNIPNKLTSIIKQISNGVKQFAKETENTPIQQKQVKKTAKKQKDSLQSHSQLSKIEMVIKQRDQLYRISQQLYDKTKQYKTENQLLLKNTKIAQNQLKSCIAQIKELRKQNISYKNKVFQLQQLKKWTHGNEQLVKLNQLVKQNEKIKYENIEYQRKFKESYRAIQQFKKDAWKAQQQNLVKDKQIASLKQELELFKTTSETKNNDRSYSGSFNCQEEKQQQKPNLQVFKMMSTLLMKNNIYRQHLMKRLNQLRQDNENNKNQLQLINMVKAKTAQIFNQLERARVKSIQVIQIRNKVMRAMNQINF